MRINLISRNNGAGLTYDMKLLDGLFTGAGHEVKQVDWRALTMPRCEVGIFLELFNPNLARYARGTIGVFNLEWFMPRWRPYLPRFKQLWAKSGEASAVYNALGLRNHHYTGFMSRNLYDGSVERGGRVFHLAGHSKLKNTEAVLMAWRDNLDLPPLTVVSNDPEHWGKLPPNVTVLPRQSDARLAAIMNAHTIHLCPSKTEGWGHYIAEALSVGAVVITTDASPMNEHVKPPWGILIDPATSVPRGRVREHIVTPQAVADAVRQAAALGDDERYSAGERARLHFEERNARFTETVLQLVRRV